MQMKRESDMQRDRAALQLISFNSQPSEWNISVAVPYLTFIVSQLVQGTPYVTAFKLNARIALGVERFKMNTNR